MSLTHASHRRRAPLLFRPRPQHGHRVGAALLALAAIGTQAQSPAARNPPLVAEAATPASVPAPAADDPAAHLQFVQEFGATCVARSGVQILMKNTHARRTLRVWLERQVAGMGTGDRSRTDLPPGAEPDALGCSRTLDGAPQAWRVVKLLFVD